MKENSDNSTPQYGNYEFYCHSIFANFPANQHFTKGIYCKSIWRKTLCVAVNFTFFHSVHTVLWCEYSIVWRNKKFTLIWKKIVKTTDYVYNLVIKLLISRTYFQNFCGKMVWAETPSPKYHFVKAKNIQFFINRYFHEFFDENKKEQISVISTEII